MSSILDLQTFVKVAETGNMSAAGRELGLSPAVVSKRILALEEKLSIRLFERTTRQLSLTDEGSSYYQHIINALVEISRAEESVQNLDETPQGQIKLTAPTGLARLHIGPLIPEFLATYPRISLDIHLTDKIVDISSEGLDLAIRIGTITDPCLTSIPILPNNRMMTAHKSYLEEFGTPKILDDLKDHNCLIFSRFNTWYLTGPDGPESVTVSGNLSSNSTEFLHEAMLEGQGIKMSTKWEMKEGLESGELVRVLPDYIASCYAGMSLVYPSREKISPKLEVFVNYMVDMFVKKGLSEF